VHSAYAAAVAAGEGRSRHQAIRCVKRRTNRCFSSRCYSKLIYDSVATQTSRHWSSRTAEAAWNSTPAIFSSKTAPSNPASIGPVDESSSICPVDDLKIKPGS